MMAGWPISCRWARLWSCPDRREVGRQPLARAIAPALGLPLIAKDTIKQALITVLPVPNIETSRLIGTASVAALLAVAAETPGAVLESVWHRSGALAGLRRLPGNIVEVFCGCDPRSRGSDTRCAQVPGTPVTRRRTGERRVVER
jgi:hypothetical protein